MPNLGRAPRKPNCTRRRNSNPGAKSSTLIFTETARLGHVRHTKGGDQLQGHVPHPMMYLPLPSPASKLQDGAHTRNCWKEGRAAWEEAEGKRQIPSLYAQTEPANTYLEYLECARTNSNNRCCLEERTGRGCVCLGGGGRAFLQILDLSSGALVWLLPYFLCCRKLGEEMMEIRNERGGEGRGINLKQQQPQPQRRASRRLILRKSSAMATGSLKSRSTKMEWTR